MQWEAIVANTPNFDKGPALPGAEFVVLVFEPNSVVRIHNGKRFTNQRNAMRIANALSGRRGFAHVEVHELYS